MSQFSASLIGQEFAGYRMTELIGEGGMAVVMKAENLVDSRIRRAFKIIKPEYKNRAQFYERFIREAIVLERLRSKHLVALHGLRQEHDQLFIELELLEGFSLDQIPTQYNNLKIEQVVQWMYQAALGLAEAHEQNIIHRDMKPGNLYLHKDQTIKILDFGIAKVTNEMESQQHETLQGHVLGSPAFMAPEVCEGKESSPQADVYGLALIAYQLILGRHPLVPLDRTLNTMQVMMTHIKTELPSLRSHCSSLPQLETVLKKAAHKNKALRYQNGAEFAQALESLFKEKISISSSEQALEFKDLNDEESFSWRAPLLTLLLIIVSIWSLNFKWNEQDREQPMLRTISKKSQVSDQLTKQANQHQLVQSKQEKKPLTTLASKSSSDQPAQKKTQQKQQKKRAETYLKALDLTWISLPDEQGRTRSILKTEVTVAQYSLCVKAGACTANFQSDKALFGRCTYPLKQVNLPVNCVTLPEAKAFAAWVDSLYQVLDSEHRTANESSFVLLPTLGDWKAALGGQIHPWGSESASCDKAVFFERSPSCEGKLAPQEVCSRPAGNNPNGACDLYGNLWEWISDPNQDEAQLALTIGGAWSSALVDLSPNATKLRSAAQKDPSVGIRLIYLH